MANMYFIALAAPKEINEDILKWKLFMKERFDCAVALRSPAHITLVPPFWMDAALENQFQDAMSDFSKEQTPFQVMLRDFAAFRPRVIFATVVSNESLNKLHSELQTFLFARPIFPISRDDRPYHPHVTIATRDLHKRSFHEAWEVFKEKKYEASWTAEGMSLFRHNNKNWDAVFTSQFEH